MNWTDKKELTHLGREISNSLLMTTTMMKPLVLIGLVGCLLAQEASGGCLSCLFKQEPKGSFDELNKWLEQSLPGVLDVDQNLAHLKGKIGQLPSPKEKRAAEIFVGFMEADKCDDNLLMDVREMVANGLSTGGLRRIERLLRTRMEYINGLCGPHLVGQVEELYRSTLEEEMGAFLEVAMMEPNKWDWPVGRFKQLKPKPSDEFYVYIGQENNTELDPKHWQWRNYLNELSKDDRKAQSHDNYRDARGKFHYKYDKEKFKYAFDTYLVGPCKWYTDVLGEPIRGFYALGDLQRADYAHTYDHLMKHRSVSFLQLLYGYKICHRLLNLDSSVIYAISLLAN